MSSNRFSKFLLTLLIFSLFSIGLPFRGLCQFVPGEVIVKFIALTEGDHAITQARQGKPGNLDSFAPILERLETSTRLPLKAKQITSGQRVVLSIDTDLLTKRAVKQLINQDNITTARIVPRSSQQPSLFPPPNVIAITFTPESQESLIIRQESFPDTDTELMMILADLERIVDLPLKVKGTMEHKLLIRFDEVTLTLNLIKRLQSGPDIESAQPNYISTFH